MIEIIPAILEPTLEAIQEKVQRIQPYTQRVQLDVMDGAFVPNQSFCQPAPLAELDIQIEVHLMIEKPSLFISQWALPNVFRLIVHYEAMGNVANEIALLRQTGKEVAIALNPETSTYEIKEHLPDIDMVLIMGVEPGFQGQAFQRDVLEKVKEIKKWEPTMKVAVDGGVTIENARYIMAAGTDVLVVGSAIWKSDN